MQVHLVMVPLAKTLGKHIELSFTFFFNHKTTQKK